MRWIKRGCIYRPDGNLSWARSHASGPTPVLMNEDIIRVYISCRDHLNVGRVGYVDLDASCPEKIVNVGEAPVLDIGSPGTFDEDGVMATSVVEMPDGVLYMYYVGFELGHKVRYRLLSGLAISTDGGYTFSRVSRTPVLERSNDELYFRCGPFVRLEKGIFRLWYVAGSDWTEVGGKMVPVYEIKYLESNDGMTWGQTGVTCIRIENDDEHGLGRPYVVKEGELYKLFYSIRRRSLGAYRVGYAESLDGINWKRQDNELGVDVSTSGWDSESICYCAPLRVREKLYLFYNGNNFGETGFGWALLDQ